MGKTEEQEVLSVGSRKQLFVGRICGWKKEKHLEVQSMGELLQIKEYRLGVSKTFISILFKITCDFCDQFIVPVEVCP